MRKRYIITKAHLVRKCCETTCFFQILHEHGLAVLIILRVELLLPAMSSFLHFLLKQNSKNQVDFSDLKSMFVLLEVMLIQYGQCLSAADITQKKCLRSVCISRPSRSFRSFWFFSTASSNLVETFFVGESGLIVGGNSDRPFE